MRILIFIIYYMNSDEYEKLRLDGLPWIEKYRPRKFDQVVLNDDLHKKLTKFIKDKNIPNMILTGITGVGKTSTITSLCYSLFGSYYDQCVFEINTFDKTSKPNDKNVKPFHDQIISFCRSKVYFKDDTVSYPKFKIVIIDNADSIKESDQFQINSIIDDYGNNTKFVFTCNTSFSIIESIQSKCLILRFLRIDDKLVINRLSFICNLEKIKFNDDALMSIAVNSRGDLRHAINMLQLIAVKYNYIKKNYVDEICDVSQVIIIKDLFDHILSKNFSSIISVIDQLKYSGYSGLDIVFGMITTLKSDSVVQHIPEKTKISFIQAISNYAYIMSKYVDSELQLLSLINELVSL